MKINLRSIAAKLAAGALVAVSVSATPSYAQTTTQQYCLDNYVNCIDKGYGGSGDAGMSQCGVWYNQCLVWGYWPGILG